MFVPLSKTVNPLTLVAPLKTRFSPGRGVTTLKPLRQESDAGRANAWDRR
jgi:hypothetical protein